MYKIFNKIENDLNKSLIENYGSTSSRITLGTQEFLVEDEKLFLYWGFNVSCEFLDDKKIMDRWNEFESDLNKLVLNAFKSEDTSNISIKESQVTDRNFSCIIFVKVRIV